MEFFSVMVTGANRGIGLGFVQQLLQMNPPPQHIFATYRDSKSIKELKSLRDEFQATTKIYLIHMDVTSSDDITNAVKIVEDVVGDKGLTFLINNAGIAQKGPFPEITSEALNLHFNVNTVGPILLTQAMYPLLKRAAEKRGDSGMSFSKAGVLNISAGVGSIQNAATDIKQVLEVPSYRISKTALNMAMRIIACEAAKDNVLVIMLCPGWVKTDMGGAYAPIDVKDSISSILKTISKLNESHSGAFMDCFGSPYAF